VVYGSTMLKKNDSLRLVVPRSVNSILYGRLPFIHQSSFVKSNVLKSNLFSDQYSVNSDFNLFLKLYIVGASFHELHELISIYDGYGFSSRSQKISYNEKLSILKANKVSTIGYLFYYYLAKFRMVLKFLLCPVIKTLKLSQFKTHC